MKISLVAFDLDGVLVDAELPHFLSLRDAIVEVTGVEISTEDDSRTKGLSTTEKLEVFSQNIELTQEQKALIRKRKYELLWNHKDSFKLNTSAHEIFKYLVGNGYQIAVVTNARMDYARRVLGVLRVRDLVSVVISGDMGIPNKPDPSMYQAAMNRVGVLPENTVIFEDSPVGIKAALSSGANLYVVERMEALTLKEVMEFL